MSGRGDRNLYCAFPLHPCDWRLHRLRNILQRLHQQAHREAAGVCWLVRCQGRPAAHIRDAICHPVLDSAKGVGVSEYSRSHRGGRGSGNAWKPVCVRGKLEVRLVYQYCIWDAFHRGVPILGGHFKVHDQQDRCQHSSLANDSSRVSG